MSDFDSMEERRAAAAARLEILDAIVTAISERARLFQITGEAATADDARSRLSTEFGWNEVQATAALDLQVRRFTEDARRRIVEDRDGVIAFLRSLEDGDV